MSDEQQTSDDPQQSTQPTSEEQDADAPVALASNAETEDTAEPPPAGEGETEGADGKQQLEALQTWRQSAHDEGFQEATSIKDRELLKVRGDHRQALELAVQEAKADGVVAEANRAMSAYITRLEAGLEPEAAARELSTVLQANPEWAGVFSDKKERALQAQRDAFIDEGRQKGVGEATILLQKGQPKGIAEKLNESIALINDQIRAGDVTQEAGYADFIKSYEEAIRADEREKIEGLKSAREGHEEKARKREETKPPVKPGGRGGGTSGNPIEDFNSGKISAAQMREAVKAGRVDLRFETPQE